MSHVSALSPGDMGMAWVHTQALSQCCLVMTQSCEPSSSTIPLQHELTCSHAGPVPALAHNDTDTDFMPQHHPTYMSMPVNVSVMP